MLLVSVGCTIFITYGVGVDRIKKIDCRRRAGIYITPAPAPTEVPPLRRDGRTPRFALSYNIESDDRRESTDQCTDRDRGRCADDIRH
jgi:hypothetical protein